MDVDNTALHIIDPNQSTTGTPGNVAAPARTGATHAPDISARPGSAAPGIIFDPKERTELLSITRDMFADIISEDKIDTLMSLFRQEGLLDRYDRPSRTFANIPDPAHFSIPGNLLYSGQKEQVYAILSRCLLINNAVKRGNDALQEADWRERTTRGWRSYFVYRDPYLKKLYELGDRYLELGRLEDAVSEYDKIINYENSKANAHPIFYNEAVFKKAEVLYLIGLNKGDKSEAKQAIRSAYALLKANMDTLMKGQFGYKASYSQKLLDICLRYQRLFEEPLASSEEIEGYFREATDISNGFTQNPLDKYTIQEFLPKFADNYIAVRAMLNYADYLSLTDPSSEKAESLYRQALQLIDDIRNSPDFVKQMRSLSQISLGDMGRALIGSETNYEKGFVSFEALAYLGLSKLYFGRSESTGDETLIRTGMRELARGFSVINSAKKDLYREFYGGGKWEERQTYYAVITEYVDTLIKHGNRPAAQRVTQEFFHDLLKVNVSDAIALKSFNKLLNAYSYLALTNPETAMPLPEEISDMRNAWEYMDAALNDIYGTANCLWAGTKCPKAWAVSADNLLQTVSRVAEIEDANDRPLLLARSYAWLGNLMKWADEGKTDPAVEQQIIELAKGLAQTDGEKAVAGTREGAIMMLYKTALEQFSQVAEKHLYLQSEEASTRYQLADLAQGILEEKEASEALKAAAEETLKGEFMQTAMTGLQGIIDSAEGAKEPEIAANALVSYADSLASGISDLLAAGEPEKAYDEAAKQFTVRAEAGAQLPKSDALLEFCKKSDCKYYYNDTDKTLVVRGKMTPEDKTELEKIFTSEADRKAIEALFISSRHSLSVETLGKPVHDKEGSIPALLTVANALISKPFAENDDNGPITRIMVSEIADMAEAQILSKHPDTSAATEAVQTQLADLASLRIYIEMGKGDRMSMDNINKYVSVDDGSIFVVLSNGKTMAVTDIFMQQKLQLALIAVWMRTGTLKDHKPVAEQWVAGILDTPKNISFLESANKIVALGVLN